MNMALSLFILNPLIFLSGLGILYYYYWCSKRNPFVFKVSAAIYTLQYILLVFLSAHSFFDWKTPLLSAINLGPSFNGALNLFPDGLSFHQGAVYSITERLTLLHTGGLDGYAVFVGFLYKYLGPYPIQIMTLNLLLMVIISTAGYHLNQKYISKRSAQISAFILICSPMLLFLSGQILKDVLFVFLCLGSLYTSYRIVSTEDATLKRTALYLVGFGCCFALLTSIRFYLIYFFLAVIGASLGYYIIEKFQNKKHFSFSPIKTMMLFIFTLSLGYHVWANNPTHYLTNFLVPYHAPADVEKINDHLRGKPNSQNTLNTYIAHLLEYSKIKSIRKGYTSVTNVNNLKKIEQKANLQKQKQKQKQKQGQAQVHGRSYEQQMLGFILKGTKALAFGYFGLIIFLMLVYWYEILFIKMSAWRFYCILFSTLFTGIGFYTITNFYTFIRINEMSAIVILMTFNWMMIPKLVYLIRNTKISIHVEVPS